MARLIALDIGRKRTGIAATDILQITPGGVAVVPTHTLIDWLKSYCTRESVEALVIGAPKQNDNTPSESCRFIEPVVNRIKKELPQLPIIRYDERFTTVLAHKAILEAGISKMKRQQKGLADEVSAVIILQDYLAYRDNMSTLNK